MNFMRTYNYIHTYIRLHLNILKDLLPTAWLFPYHLYLDKLSVPLMGSNLVMLFYHDFESQMLCFLVVLVVLVSLVVLVL